jgi:hypothetical protein
MLDDFRILIRSPSHHIYVWERELYDGGVIADHTLGIFEDDWSFVSVVERKNSAY